MHKYYILFKGKGTVKESKDFNAEDDVTKLHEAMKGLGTDEQAIIDILSARSNGQRQTLKKKYKEKYEKVFFTDMDDYMCLNIFLHTCILYLMLYYGLLQCCIGFISFSEMRNH